MTTCAVLKNSNVANYKLQKVGDMLNIVILFLILYHNEIVFCFFFYLFIQLSVRIQLSVQISVRWQAMNFSNNGLNGKHVFWF